MKKMLLFSLLMLVAVGISVPSFAVSGSSSASGSNENTQPQVLASVPAMDATKTALAEFKHLARAERKERLKEVKKEIKTFKAQKASGAAPSTNTLLLVILAILLPPLAVGLHQGELNGTFWLNVVLTLLGYLPGIIHALIVVLGS